MKKVVQISLLGPMVTLAAAGSDIGNPYARVGDNEDQFRNFQEIVARAGF